MNSSPTIKEPFVTFDDVYAPNKKYSYGENEHSSCNDIFDTCGCIMVVIGGIFCGCFNN
jgi:hypothetical protein